MSDSVPTTVLAGLFSATDAFESRMSVGAWFGVTTAKLASLSVPDRVFRSDVGQRSDHGVGWAVFGDRCVREQDVGRRMVRRDDREVGVAQRARQVVPI